MRRGLLGILLASAALTHGQITRIVTDYTGGNVLVTTTLRIPGMPQAAPNPTALTHNFVRLRADGTPAGAIADLPAFHSTLVGFSQDGAAALYMLRTESDLPLIRQDIESGMIMSRNDAIHRVSPNLKWAIADSADLLNLETGERIPTGLQEIRAVVNDGTLLAKDASGTLGVTFPGGRFVPIPSGIDIDYASLSPDGTNIAYMRCAATECPPTSRFREFEVVAAPVDDLQNAKVVTPGVLLGFTGASGQWLSFVLTSGTTGIVRIDGSGLRYLGQLNRDFLSFDVSGDGKVLYVLRADYSIDRHELNGQEARRKVTEALSLINPVSIAPGQFANVMGTGLESESLRFELNTGENLRVRERLILAPATLPYGRYTLRAQPWTNPFLQPEGNLTVKACALHPMPGRRTYEDGTMEAQVSGVGPPEALERKLRTMSVIGYYMNPRGLWYEVASTRDAEVKSTNEPGIFLVRWKWDRPSALIIGGIRFRYGTDCESGLVR
jgi:hypothetical protein